jgi:hypothetical protein
MKMQEFITKELMRIAGSDIIRSFSNEKSKILIEHIKLLLTDQDILDYNELLIIIKNDEQLSSLKTFKWHVEQLVKINKSYGSIFDPPSDNFIETDIKNVNELIKSQPKNRLLPFFWITYNIEALRANELFISDMASFYEVIFTKYGYFIDLDDFFKKTDLLNPNYFIENSVGDYFIPVFQKAVERFPEKLALKKSLALFLYKNQNYKGTVEILKSIFDQIQNNDKFPVCYTQDNFYSYDYIDLMQLIALSYEKLGEIDKVPHYVNNVLENLLSINTIDGEENQKDIYSHLDSFFLRMRINFRNGEYQKVKEDYQTILPFLDIDSEHWDHEYGDILNQLDKL